LLGHNTPAFAVKAISPINSAVPHSRSATSLAEGFERGTTKELLHFIYIPLGSAGEARSMLCVMDRMADVADLNSQIASFKSDFENVS
tara:strand:- start:140604 stop:140867 length:264 start_codon:yes stop_codon:yes gene_type:complete